MAVSSNVERSISSTSGPTSVGTTRRWARAVVVALALSVSAGACDSNGDAQDVGSTASRQEAMTSAPFAVVSFDSSYPVRTSPDDVTVGASESLELGPEVRILASDGAPGTVTNTGERGTFLAPRSRVGAVLSVGRVVVGSHSTVTSVTSSRDVKVERGARVGTVREDTSLTPLAVTTFLAHAATSEDEEQDHHRYEHDEHRRRSGARDHHDEHPGDSHDRRRDDEDHHGGRDDGPSKHGSSHSVGGGHSGGRGGHDHPDGHGHGRGAPDVRVGPRDVTSIAPGHYGKVTVASRGSLVLTAGTYVVDRFSIAPRAELRLDDAAAGTIDVYATEAAGFSGKIVGDGGRFVLASLSRGALELTAGFRGTALAPNGTLVLGRGEHDEVYEGTFYGKRVFVGPDLTIKKLPVPPFGADIEGCAERVPLREDLPPEARNVAYQTDLARWCLAPGLSSCQSQLIGRVNVDYTAAAVRVVAQQFSPAEYLALSRDRTRKLHAAEADATIATRLCVGSDSDGDWVPDAIDQCPDTPDLVATDDVGCPLPTLPPAPAPEAVAQILSTMHLAVNPKCRDAPVPDRVPAGAFYYPAHLDRGTYILSGSVQNQAPGCPVWYEFDIEEVSGASAGARYSVTFMDREAKAGLLELGRPVPEGFVQFNPRPDDVGMRDRLARTDSHATLRYRVRAMNGNGTRGPWSSFKLTSEPGTCRALGFTCSNN